MILYESQLFALALNGQTYSVAWMLGKLNSFYTPLDKTRIQRSTDKHTLLHSLLYFIKESINSRDPFGKIFMIRRMKAQKSIPILAMLARVSTHWLKCQLSTNEKKFQPS